MSHYFETPSQRSEQAVAMTLWGHDVTLASSRGVFSAGGLDLGTSVLLRTVPPPRSATRLLDLGCGIGPLTLALALECPRAHVTAVDVNDVAVDLTRRNAASAGVAQRVTACRPEQVDPSVTFDEIWSNPPIRIGKPALHELLLTWLPRLASTPFRQRWVRQPTPRACGQRPRRSLITIAEDVDRAQRSYWYSFHLVAARRITGTMKS